MIKIIARIINLNQFLSIFSSISINFRSTSHGIVLITSGPQVNCTTASEPSEVLVINRPERIKIPPLLAALASHITA